MNFLKRIPELTTRVERTLDTCLPAAACRPARLHAAMRYAVLGGGKRIRPLLCYAAGEALGVDPSELDDAACAVELIHAFSLVHDDLPAMDDDALRRGRPTVHKAFDVATAILAGDALQTLAFNVLAQAADGRVRERLGMLALLAEATGSLGMTGGQAIDLAAEGGRLTVDELETLHRLKTGCLIRASVGMACCARPDINPAVRENLDHYAESIGLAFQIRDDILDVEGDTATLGKTQGADIAHDKATYPALLGMEAAKQRAENFYRQALDALAPFGEAAEGLRELAELIVKRDR
ncbi:MAG TPA: farnesyl diphosphate synthase [Gammaproteobacteria bacterium]|nr:farnesyl diphosphate synthase [Gammaproteobacteria bacterium]